MSPEYKLLSRPTFWLAGAARAGTPSLRLPRDGPWELLLPRGAGRPLKRRAPGRRLRHQEAIADAAANGVHRSKLQPSLKAKVRRAATSAGKTPPNPLKAFRLVVNTLHLPCCPCRLGCDSCHGNCLFCRITK